MIGPAHAAPTPAAPLRAVPAVKPPPAGPRVTLPHPGAYAYWIQSKLGAVSAMPVTVNAQPQFTLPAPADGEGTLYVLDKDTGYVAQMPLSATPAKPLALAVGDFKPILPPAASMVVPPTSPPATPAAPRPAPVGDDGLARLLTGFCGLLVGAGVVWIVLRLIQSRGRPLIAAARRLGVDVPDPAETPTEDPAATQVYAPPASRAPERIPDEAGVSPPPAAPARRAPAGTSGTPQIVGVQGIAAGSAFAVPPGEVVIGRDGDNGIVLAENTVSRRHARLLHDGAGQITLTDEGSVNGVYVNGKRITQAVLTPGDQIQIGDSYFRLEA